MNIVIIGATSGIGEALFNIYIESGHTVGIAGRRTSRLHELQQGAPHTTIVQTIDIGNKLAVETGVSAFKSQMGHIDLVIVCAGTGHLNPELDYEKEHSTLATNIVGWTHVIDYCYLLLQAQGYGQLVAITSAGGLRGEPAAPAYSASKAYQINYIEALRKKSFKDSRHITVTDIRPGLVDTAMAKGEGLFWVMPTHKVAHQIVQAIERKATKCYVTRRWRWVAMLNKSLPWNIYKWL